MTGKYPARMNTTDYFGAPQPETMSGNWKRNKPLRPANYEDRLKHEEVTIAEALKSSGYQTYFLGKWHLGGEGFLPTDQGFDVNIGGYEVGMPQSGYYAPWNNPYLKADAEDEYLTERLTAESISLMRTRDASQPFLL